MAGEILQLPALELERRERANNDLGALQSVLRTGAGAQSSLAGLNEEYADAYNRSNTPTAKATGDWGGVLQELGNTATRYFGKKDLMGLKQARASAREGVANAASAKENYALTQAMNAVNQTQENYHGTAAATVDAAELKNSNSKTAAELKNTQDVAAQRNAGKTVNVVERHGKDEDAYAAWLDGNGNLTVDGKLVPSGEVANLRIVNGGGSNTSIDVKNGNGAKMPNAQITEMVNASTLSEEAVSVLKGYEKLSPDDQKKMGSWQEKIKNTVTKAAMPEDFEGYATAAASGLSDEGKAYVQQVASLIAQGKHQLFGSALTKGENESAKAFLARVLEAPIEQVLMGIRAEGLRNNNIVKSLNKGFGNYATKPEYTSRSGVDADILYSPKERERRVLARGNGGLPQATVTKTPTVTETETPTETETVPLTPEEFSAGISAATTADDVIKYVRANNTRLSEEQIVQLRAKHVRLGGE